jgi:pyruvate-formate lyase-activating enzyme
MNVAEDLKLHLLSQGLRITDRARHRITEGGSLPVSLHDYVTTSGVILKLPGEVYVNAPTDDAFCASSPYSLDSSDSELNLVGPSGVLPVEHVPIPAYVLENNRDGLPFRGFAITHTDRVRAAPVAGCAFRCAFCDLPYTYAYTTKRIEHLVEAVQAGLHDRILPARHVLVSGGTPRAQDREYLLKSLRAICRSTDAPVDAMLVPWHDPDFLVRLRDSGIDGVFFNLELYGETAARQMMPQKASFGNSALLETLRRAVPVFGERKVRSLILAGLEPVSDTLRGVEAIVSVGAIPILSPFRPSSATPLRNVPPPTLEVLKEAYTGALTISRRFGLPLGPDCIPCQHNTLAFPSSLQ